MACRVRDLNDETHKSSFALYNLKPGNLVVKETLFKDLEALIAADPTVSYL
jgi:hypothetical protein